MPAAEMATTFEALAPAGIGLTDVMLTNEDRAPGEPETDSPGYLRADLTLDGQTVGGVNVDPLRHRPAGEPVLLPRQPDLARRVRRDQGRGRPGGRASIGVDPGQVVINEVVLVRPNGGLVYVAASNSADDKPGAGSTVAGPTVPLTLDELQDIAEDDAWLGYEPAAGQEKLSPTQPLWIRGSPAGLSVLDAWMSYVQRTPSRSTGERGLDDGRHRPGLPTTAREAASPARRRTGPRRG